MTNNNDNNLDPRNLERLRLQERIAEEGGFSLQPPIFALGTPVNEIGRENFRKSRKDFEALPPARTVFRPFLERVAAEVRKDVVVPVNSVTMLEDGRITRGNGALLLDGTRTFRQLLERTPCEEPGAAAKYLSIISPERRASEVNHWLRHAEEGDSMVLRTRNAIAQNNGGLMGYGKEVFAIVSEGYSRGLEVDSLVEHVQTMLADEILPGDARAEVTYDGRRMSVRILWHSNILPEQVCAGEVFKASVSINAADDTSKGLEVFKEVLRNLCLNLIILHDAKVAMGRKVHRGDTAKLVQWLYSTVRAAVQGVRGFAELWQGANTRYLNAPNVVRDLPANTTNADVVKGVYRGLLKQGRVKVPGYRREAAVDALFQRWNVEPKAHVAGVVNGITRAAHELDFPNVWAGQELEQQAGQVLAARKPFQWVGPEGEEF